VWLEDEKAPQAASPSASVGRAAVAHSDQEKAIRRQQAISEAGARKGRSVVERTAPRVKRGLPGPMIALLWVGGVAVALLALWQAFLKEAAEGPSPVWATLGKAQQLIDDGALEKATERLDSIAGSAATRDEEKRLLELRGLIGRRRDQRELDSHNMVGTRYKDTKIAKYEQQYLQGSPDRSRVRVFLKRVAYFKERWPDHPNTAWVDRQASRFDGYVDMGAPPTFEDVAWEIKCLTKVSPRDYKECFRLLDGFIEREGAIPEVVTLRGELEAERREYHDDRMKQAAWEFEREQKTKAVLWLVKAITMIGDEEMEDQAATFLVRIPEVEDNLRGYQSDRPEEFELIMQNEIVRDFAREMGLL
ncbi:MAG: hypothetical protein O7B99_11730, partial [Planctomycetota bacterium]|nr:hypothetical protein [Planctomycetota bacterium]